MAKNADPKIFLVDDDILSLNLYRQFMKQLNYFDVHMYDSGTECIENLSLQPDVCFLDYTMEDMNGIEVLKRIKKFNPNIIVLFISGNENKEVAASAIKHGAIDFIVKSSLSQDRIKEAMKQIEELRQIKHVPAKRSFFQKMAGSLGI